MKVSDFRPEAARPNESRLDRPEKLSVKREESRPEASSDKVSSDNVSLSAVSETLLRKLDNSARVEALKSSYEAGAYKVNPEDLAKSMMKTQFAPAEGKQLSRPTPKAPPEKR